MREIKFRVWDEEEYISLSQALYQGLVGVQHNRTDGYSLESYYSHVVIEQYTGLKDKNGKEIYEGDILKLSFFMTSEKGIVKFGQYKNWAMSNDYECGNQGFYVDVTNDKHSSWRKDIWFYHSNCEVIGNIYENPELLEEQDV